ncbi:hypothetical protein GW920_00340 [Candidatus Falkowbacteria bacterium]|nr:hypothetical protein [Candidatus Falkowbacteria bacterium]NCQ13094.1 hypothetical protein [Candidatus Falkowbacteria bacterium]OIO05711.1 MAG: hypothetical protein AUJ26_02500 [Candidatus Falkowbacteria bacterium CG1_02_37_21]
MNNKNNAKYAFYYLLSLVSLIFMGLSVGMIAFGIINKSIVDTLNSYSGNYDSQLRFAISALFIAAPMFYVITRLINKGLKNDELAKDSGIRRWLTYFILLISFLIILGSFITVINNFLSGEMTVRFILKAITVLLISGSVFSFYLYDMKREIDQSRNKVVMVFTWASVALVLAAFIAAWFFVESPAISRARRLDQNLMNNIYSLESAVNNFYEINKTLPESLATLENSEVYLSKRMLADPDNQEPIVYNKLSDKTFEFCATFRMDSTTDDMNSGYRGDNKDHQAGYQCLPGLLYSVPDAAILKY